MSMEKSSSNESIKGKYQQSPSNKVKFNEN